MTRSEPRVVVALVVVVGGGGGFIVGIRVGRGDCRRRTLASLLGITLATSCTTVFAAPAGESGATRSTRSPTPLHRRAIRPAARRG